MDSSVSRSPRSRNWCWTINNPTCDDTQTVVDYGYLIAQQRGYLLFGRENSKTGTPHLQGFVHFEHAVTRGGVARKLGGRAHLEFMRGTLVQAMTYCKKENDWLDWGTPPAQGRRSDLAAVRQLIEDQPEFNELAVAQSNFPQWVLHRRAFREYAQLLGRRTAAARPDPRIVVLWGDSGTGKSRKAAADYPAAYWLTRPNCSTVWWDGYDGQSVVVIDEFYGWIPLGVVLSLCDRHPLMVRTQERGYVPCAATTIVFTSNVRYQDWWPNLGPERTSAFARRVEEYGSVTRFQRLGAEPAARSSTPNPTRSRPESTTLLGHSPWPTGPSGRTRSRMRPTQESLPSPKRARTGALSPTTIVEPPM